MVTDNHTEDVSLADISGLVPHPRNPNTHPQSQIKALAKIINHQGWRAPIVVSKRSGFIIAGHGRLEAAKLLGLEQVPVSYQDFPTEADEWAHMIADNRLSELAEIDNIELGSLMRELDVDGFDLSLTGFDELGDLLEDPEGGTEGLTDEDAVPDAPEVPITKPGDIWVLGRHRLMCGDSTSIDAVDRLMDGRKSNMVFTDPPYLMDFTGAINNDGSKSHSSIHGAIKNDKMSREDGDKFIGDIVSNIKIFNDGAYYICFYRLGMDYVLRALDANKLKYRAMIVWYKKGGTLSNSDYKSNYEPIFYGWINEHKFYGGKSEWDFWDISKTSKNDLHPTMKPVELCERAIKNSSQINGIVLDLFGGSGSTLIACEKTNRDCRMIELDPKYCDVIIKRWQDFTGKEATNEATGKAFNAS